MKDEYDRDAICRLYQPFQEQILIYDIASSFAVQAYLKMCNLNFSLERRANAEFMSSTDNLPFITYDGSIISGFENIVSFLHSKGIEQELPLSSQEKADVKAYTSLAMHNIFMPELYLCWKDPETYSTYTYPRYSCTYPWPLGMVLSWQKKRWASKRLYPMNRAIYSKETAIENMSNAFQKFSELLDEKLYFFGVCYSELDALIFGHVAAILEDSYFFKKLGSLILKSSGLYEHYKRISEKFFTGITEARYF